MRAPLPGWRAGPREVPVAPDADEARRWARDELARSDYNTEPSVVERVWRWITERITDFSEFNAAAPPNLVPIIVVLAVAVLLGVALYLGGPLRTRRRATATDSFVVFDDDEADSAELTAAADEAARKQDWPTAVLMRFRAIIRSLDERGILDDVPGMTAREATTAAGARLPDLQRPLRWAGDLFDAVCYGSARPGASEDQHLRQLAGDVAGARAVPARSARAEGWVGVS